MTKLNELVKDLRGKESLRDAAERIGVSHSYLRLIEKGKDPRSGTPIEPSVDTLKKISRAYNYDFDKLMVAAGYIDKDRFTSNGEDDRDIAKRLQQIRNDMEHEDGLAFDGEPMSDEAMESFMEAMEYVVRQTKRINKKYIPKKYRKDDLDE